MCAASDTFITVIINNGCDENTNTKGEIKQQVKQLWNCSLCLQYYINPKEVIKLAAGYWLRTNMTDGE